MANTENRELIKALDGIKNAIEDLTREIKKAARSSRPAEDGETESAPPVPADIIGNLLNKNTYGGSKGGTSR